MDTNIKMIKSTFYAGLLMRAKLRSLKLLTAEVLSPSLIMLMTFVLGWAISTTDRFQVFMFADCSHQLFRAEADILRNAAWLKDIHTCLSPLAHAMSSEVVRRQNDRKVAQHHERWRQEQANRRGNGNRAFATMVEDTHGDEHQLQRQLQQEGTQKDDESTTSDSQGKRQQRWPKQRVWRMNWGAIRHRGEVNVTRSPGELAGRDFVMALLSAAKKPNVFKALDECRWREMWVSAFPATVVNIFNQMLGPTALLTLDEWLMLSSSINATLAASGRRSTVEATLQFLMPIMPLQGMQPGWLALVPDNPQVRAFAAHMSASTLFFDDVFLGVFDSADAAMDAAAIAKAPAPRAAATAGLNRTNGTGRARGRGGKGRSRRRPLVTPGRLWAVLEFASGPEPGLGVDYAIRMNAMHVPNTFSKMSSPECKTCSTDFVPYVVSGFLSLQAAVSGYVLGMSRVGAGILERHPGAGTGVDGDCATPHFSEATAWLHNPAHTAAASGCAGNASSSQGDASRATAGAPSKPYGIWFTPLPNMGQEVNAFYEYGAVLLGILTTCSFAMPLALMVRSMTSQRQSGLQHLLEVVGLSHWEWQLAWIVAGLPVIAASFAVEGLLAGSTYLELVQPSLLAAVMGAAALATAAWAVLMGSCFRDAKVAAAGSFVITLAAALPFLALYATAPMQLLVTKRSFCLLWPFALSILLQRMAAGHQLKRFGVDRAVSSVPGLEWGSVTHGPLSTAEILGFFILDAVLYLVAAAVLAAWHGLSAEHGVGWMWGKGGRSKAGSSSNRGRCTAVLKLRGVTHRYRGNEHRVLHGVNLTVGAGEAVALLGRNAAGKSSLMAVSCGRMAPNEGGDVRVADQVMYGSTSGSSNLYRHMGYCPQGNVLLLELTALEHLQLALVLRGGSKWGFSQGSRNLRAAAIKLASVVSLPEDMLQLLVSQLSGGSKRKLQLAVAMAGEPPLLLLDEVTSGVDAESCQAVWEALLAAKRGPWGTTAHANEGGVSAGTGASTLGARMASVEQSDGLTGRGAALLFTSHHLPEVQRLADWVAVMNSGSLQSLRPAAELRSLLEGGEQRMLRIITWPAPLMSTQVPEDTITPMETPAASSWELGPGLPCTRQPTFTRSQLLDLVIRRLGSNTARVLYSNLTFTAVLRDLTDPAAEKVSSMAAAGDRSVTPAPSLTPLQLLLRDLSPQQPSSRKVDSDGGTGPTGNIANATVDGVRLGPIHPSSSVSSSNDVRDSQWEAQPLIVVRYGIGAPGLEDILLLGSEEFKGGAQSLSLDWQVPAAREGAGRAGGKGNPAFMTASPATTSAISLSNTDTKDGHTGKAKSPHHRDVTTTSIPGNVGISLHDSDKLHAVAAAKESPHPYPQSQPAAAAAADGKYIGRGGGLLSDVWASLPPLLTKQRLTWFRDFASSIRLMLLPLMVVGLAIVALSIRPASTGPPAPLNLAWLGQDQPTPVVGLPPAWRHAAASRGGNRGSGGSGNAGSWAGAEQLSSSVALEAELISLGMMPLRAEWLKAEGMGRDPEKDPSSFDASVWFASRSRAATDGLGGMAQEPSAPLQSMMVFRDLVIPRLNRTAWISMAWLLEALLAPLEFERLGIREEPHLRKALQTIKEEEGAMWKMFDFLYDRMLLHELVSLVRYVTKEAGKASSLSDAANLLAFLQGPGRLGGMQAGGQKVAPTRRLTASVEGNTSSVVAAGRGGGGDDFFSFFNLGRIIQLCELKVPGSEGEDKNEQEEEEEGELTGSGGRTLLMSYRPSLHVGLYLLAGLLPPEPRFCPLARLMVEYSQTTAQVIQRYRARRNLPAINLMWNISSPHGLPATLNHFYNTILQLQMDNSQLPKAGGSERDDISGGHDEGRRQYAERVYSDTAIRVRNHPLPAHGTTSSFAGLLEHLLLALMVALPLSYTTGSFVVRAVSETVSGAKYQQLSARRASPISYWLSFWLTDMVLYALITAAVMGLMLVGGTEAFVGSPTRCGGLAALLMGFAAASLPWGYCIGLRSANTATAQGLVSTVGLVAGVGLAMARQVLAHVPRWSWLAKELLPLLRLVPPFCLVDGLIQMSLLDVILALSGLFGKRAAKRGLLRSILEGHLVGIDPANPSPFQDAVLGDNLRFLAIDTILYGAVLLSLEWLTSRGSLFPTTGSFPGVQIMRRLSAILKNTAGMVTACWDSLFQRHSGVNEDDHEYGNVSQDEKDCASSAISKPLHARWTKMSGVGCSSRRGTRDCYGGAPQVLLSTQQATEDVRDDGFLIASPKTRSKYLVVVHNVFKEYGYGRNKLVALQGLSMNLRSGECFALIGRNGAGKSTALAVLSGRLSPSGGSVVVGGVRVEGRPEAARGRVALCPQTNPLLPHLTATEHLALYSALLGVNSSAISGARRQAGAVAAPPVKAAAVAAQCGLPAEQLHRFAGQLSGGSQRKLSLAIALLGSPQLLLLDEPSAGLDPPARRDICDAINMAVRGYAVGKNGNGGTGTQPAKPAVVITTHYAEEAVALCNMVGILEAGRLLVSGPPEEVPRRLHTVRSTHYLADPAEWGAVLTPLLDERTKGAAHAFQA